MESLAWVMWISSAIVGLLLMEQLSYLRKKRQLPGPLLICPLFGSIMAMIRNPAAFWEVQASAARRSPSGISANSLMGRFMLYISDAELSKKVFTNVKPGLFQVGGHPLERKLFGEWSLALMSSDEHKTIRGHLAPLLSVKAVSVYIGIQERTIRQHLQRWVEAKPKPQPVSLRPLCRSLSLETSQNVFVGPYLSPDERKQFAEDYKLFNEGLLTLPINFPGFACYKAVQAASRLVETLERCARQSRKRMSQGVEPECFLDFWMLESSLSNRHIAHLMSNFLFAAQDASTSSLLWVAVLLESHPDVLAKLREELNTIRLSSPVTADDLRAMKYTEMVVKEVLRFRPPAMVVPHDTLSDFPITDNYVIPKGSIVFPSVIEPSRQGFNDPHCFDPDRFSAQRREGVVYNNNWLIFGAGPHYCPGQHYAMNQLVLFTSILATTLEWSRVRTPDCDDFKYVPTIVPKDDGLFILSKFHNAL